jgi:hypothetical protein
MPKSKGAMRFRRFALRGLAKLRGEWDLVCAAFDLRRLCAHAVAAGRPRPPERAWSPATSTSISGRRARLRRANLIAAPASPAAAPR